MPPSQLVSVKSLIWQHVWTSEGPVQASSIKYKKLILYNCIKFLTELSIFQFDNVHVALSSAVYKKRLKG
jgi:hypothetical protein